jgi:tetratricopeptide (TPR) repeat protein
MQSVIDTGHLENRAVEAAMKARWDEAVALNAQILKADKRNLPATLRLGFAYLQKGDLKHAREHYQKALRVQPGNLLARDNLDRLKLLTVKTAKKNAKKLIQFDPSRFLEIPGATKSVPLVNIGQKNILASLLIGEEVILKPKRVRVEVRAGSNEYLGALPDDLSKRLLLFLKAGSTYQAFTKEVSVSRVVVFIREVTKGKKVQHFTSFPKDMQKNIGNLEHIDEGGEDQGEVDENEHALDIERMAETLHEEKEYSAFERHANDEDEENIEE